MAITMPMMMMTTTITMSFLNEVECWLVHLAVVIVFMLIMYTRHVCLRYVVLRVISPSIPQMSFSKRLI